MSGVAPIRGRLKVCNSFWFYPASWAVLLVSPELAIAFALGVFGYLARFGQLRRWTNLLAYLLSIAAVAVALWLAGRLGELDDLIAFRSGGFNLPIIPSPHILFFLLTLGLTAAFAGQQVRLGRRGAVLMLIGVGAPAIVGALGRCDSTHILLDPLGLTIAAFAISNGSPNFGRVYRLGAYFIFLLLPLPGLLTSESTTLAKAALPALFRAERQGPPGWLNRLVVEPATAALGGERAAKKLAYIRYLARRGAAAVVASETYGFPRGTDFAAPFSFTITRFGTVPFAGDRQRFLPVRAGHLHFGGGRP